LDATEQKILEAACQVFAQHGKAATIRQIVAQAGIKNNAAINYYFGDKDKLYEAALRHAFQCRLDDLDVPHWHAGTPLGVKLRDLIHVIVGRMIVANVPWHRQLLFRELADPGEAGKGIVAAQAIRLVVGEAEADTYTAERIAEHVTDFSLRALGIDPASLSVATEVVS
jgi:AcrR family transcriptional regulator